MSKELFEVVRAEGDGNCAFNAFALALCTSETLEAVEALFAGCNTKDNPIHQFYRRVASSLGRSADDLQSVKRAIIELRRSDLYKLQKSLAYHLRQLACDLRFPSSAQDDFIEQLQSAYLNQKNPITASGQYGGQDDIFSSHNVIQDKFKELLGRRPRQSDEVDRIILAEWWNVQGFNAFLNRMRENGVWAGDVELTALAKHFRLNLNISTDFFQGMFNKEFGALHCAAVSPEIVDQLVKRGVIARPNQGQTVLPVAPFDLPPDKVRQRIGGLPPDVITKIVKAWPDGNNIRGIGLVDGLSESTITELEALNIIKKVGRGYVFTKDSKNEVLELIQPISSDASVIQLITDSSHDKSPTIFLHNTGVHWNALMEKKLSWIQWQVNIKQKYAVAPLPETDTDRVKYSLSNGEIIYVTKKDQIAGDEALARQLAKEFEEEENNRSSSLKP